MLGANGVPMFGGGMGGHAMQMGGHQPMQVAMVNGQPMMVQSSMMAQPSMMAQQMAQQQAHAAQPGMMAQVQVQQAQVQQPAMMAQQQAHAPQPAMLAQQAQPAMVPAAAYAEAASYMPPPAAPPSLAVMAMAMPEAGRAPEATSQRAEEEDEDEVAEILGDALPPPEHEMADLPGACPAPFSRSQLAKPMPTSDEGAVFKEPGPKMQMQMQMPSSAVTFEDAHEGLDNEVADLTSKVSLARLQEAQQAQAQEAQARAAQAHVYKPKSNRSGTEGSNASRCSRDTRSEADLSQEGSSENQDVEGATGEGSKGIHGRKLGAMRMLKRLGSASRRSRTSTTDAVLEEAAPPEQP